MQLRTGEEQKFRIFGRGRRVAIYLTNDVMRDALLRYRASGSRAGDAAAPLTCSSTDIGRGARPRFGGTLL